MSGFITIQNGKTILIENFKQNWRAGQIVSNPLRGKEFCPLDKCARKHGIKPRENLLADAKKLEVIYCGPSRLMTSDHQGQFLHCAGNQVEVSIIE